MKALEWEAQRIYKAASEDNLKIVRQQEELELVDERRENNQEKWTKQLAFVGCAATIGAAVPVGYCAGIVNSPAEFMRGWCNQTLIERYEWHLSEADINILWATIVSIFLVGGGIGSLVGAQLVNRFGRRTCHLSCGVLYIIAAILFYTCRSLRSVEALVIARFIAGLAAGLSTACLPLYLVEVAPSSKRSVLGVFLSIGVTAGVVVAQIISLRSVFGNADQWHLAMSVYLIAVLICYAPVHYYPESPKWLYIIKGDKEGARRQLKTLRGNVSATDISKEMAEMETEANVNKQVCDYGTVLRDPKLRLPLIIVCAYMGGQQWTGVNAIFFYSVSIFIKAGLSVSAAEWTNLGVGSLNLAASLMGPYIMTRYNCRTLLLCSTFFCFLTLTGFTLFHYFIDYMPWFSFGCIFCILLYIVFFQVGLGPIPFYIASELLEVAPRSVVMCIGTVLSWVCNFTIGMLFPPIQDAWGSLVFIPFSVACAMLFLLTKRYVPETKGRDLSEVVQLLANGFKSNVFERKKTQA